MIGFSREAVAISTGQRLITLEDDAYDVRQRAIRDGDDLGGWRLARRMREATSPRHATRAERQLAVWRLIRSPRLRVVAPTAPAS